MNYHHKIKLTTLDFSEVPYEINTLAMMFQSLTYLILISAWFKVLLQILRSMQTLMVVKQTYLII